MPIKPPTIVTELDDRNYKLYLALEGEPNLLIARRRD